MFADSEDVRGENGLKFSEILSANFKREMGDGLVEIENIEGEEIDMHLYFIESSCFTRAGCQDLEGQQLFSVFVDGDNFAVDDEAAQLVFLSQHVLLDILHQVHIGLSDVFQISREYLDDSLVEMHLSSQAIVLELASEVFALETAQNVSDSTSGLCQHRLARNS